MSPAHLQSLTAFLAPALPYLVRITDKSLEEFGKKYGEMAWSRAQQIWDRLKAAFVHKPEQTEAVGQAAAKIDENGDDASAVASIEIVLKGLLEQDPQLAAEVLSLLQDAERESNNGAAFEIKAQFAKAIVNIAHNSGPMTFS